MKFGDYRPPQTPSLDQQRDALQKGLGRALQAAQHGRLREEPLLDACLNDKRFDRQIDGQRGDWLWRIIQAMGAAYRFRVPILHALYELPEDNAEQLCGLARCYAGSGDETYRVRLYEVVEQKPISDFPWLGEEEILTLDGEPAFLFAARVRGNSLAAREWEWHDRSLLDLAIKQFGEERITGLLAGTSDGDLRRFREAWRNNVRTTAAGEQIYRERMRSISLQHVLQAAEPDGEGGIWLRGWGRHADPADLQIVLQHLWAVRDARAISKLLRVFSARGLPEFDARLIDLCRHADDAVRQRAFAVLELHSHPLIREFALSELRNGLTHSAAIGLFIQNYAPGDEHRILEAIDLPEDPCELHWLLMDLVKILQNNPEADASELGVISYACTPCADCRFCAAKLIAERDAAPAWLLEECRSDSEEDSRILGDAQKDKSGGS